MITQTYSLKEEAMVKIIQPGNLELKKPWWTRKEWVCYVCKCRWFAEEGDPVSNHLTEDFRGEEYYSGVDMKCPTCGTEVWLQQGKDR